MEVVTIKEECHGFIGVAKDYESAQNYVIDSWLDGNVYIYPDDKEQTIKEVFGENWKNALKEMPFIIFEELMNDQFWFYEETLIGSGENENP
jgi:uncharacterized membrane protein